MVLHYIKKNRTYPEHGWRMYTMVFFKQKKNVTRRSGTSGLVGVLAVMLVASSAASNLRFVRGGQRCFRVTVPRLLWHVAPPLPCPTRMRTSRSLFSCLRVCSCRSSCRCSRWVGWCVCCCASCIMHSDLRFARGGQPSFRVCLACTLLFVSCDFVW